MDNDDTLVVVEDSEVDATWGSQPVKRLLEPELRRQIENVDLLSPRKTQSQDSKSPKPLTIVESPRGSKPSSPKGSPSQPKAVERCPEPSEPKPEPSQRPVERCPEPSERPVERSPEPSQRPVKRSPCPGPSQLPPKHPCEPSKRPVKRSHEPSQAVQRSPEPSQASKDLPVPSMPSDAPSTPKSSRVPLDPKPAKKQRSCEPGDSDMGDSAMHEGRPVARPLKALKDMLATKAAEMRMARAAELEESVLKPADSAEVGANDAEVLTRRDQLSLAPAPKAKGKAKAKAKGKAQTKAKATGSEDQAPAPKAKGRGSKAKVPEDALNEVAKSPKPPAKRAAKVPEAKVPEDAAKVPEDAPNEVAESPNPPAKGANKGRGRGGRKGKGKAPNVSEEPVNAPANARQLRTPQEVMDYLHNDDWMMQAVLQTLEALKTPAEEIPTRDTPQKLPAFDHWQLSVYWTRCSIGLLHKKVKPPHIYCGCFSAGGSDNLAVAVDLIQDYAPCLWF